MKRTRAIILLWAAVFVGGVSAVVWLSPPPEPSYRGRSLTSWLLQAGTNINFQELPPLDSGLPAPEIRSAQGREAVEAVRGLGTNALPSLLRWLEHPNSSARRTAHEILLLVPAEYRKGPGSKTHQRIARLSLVPLGFEILGRDGIAAIPRLEKLMQDPTAESDTREGAMAVLSRMGRPGLEVLLRGLVNPQQPARRLTAFHISSMGYLGTNLAPAIPILIRCLQDTNTDIAGRSGAALGHLHLESALVVPALADSLRDPRPFVRGSAIEALERFGPEARLAAPALTNALTDSSAQVRYHATNILARLSR